jgi:hypothetical protein
VLDGALRDGTDAPASKVDGPVPSSVPGSDSTDMSVETTESVDTAEPFLTRINAALGTGKSADAWRECEAVSSSVSSVSLSLLPAVGGRMDR